MKTSTQTTLPEFVIKSHGQIAIPSRTDNPFRKIHVILFEIMCPRKDCLLTFFISAAWWSSKEEFIGRSCPYCFKASRIPDFPS